MPHETGSSPWRQIKMQFTSGEVSARAFPTVTLGLVCVFHEDVWFVMHERSGSAIMSTPCPERAQYFASLLSEHDWTRMPSELQKDNALMDSVASFMTKETKIANCASAAGNLVLNDVGNSLR